MPPNFWEIAAATLLSGLIGGGVIAAIGYRSLRDRLRQDFMALDEGKKIERNIEAVHGLFARVDTLIDGQQQAILRLQEEAKHRWEPLSRIMERMDERQSRHEGTLAKVEAGLERTAMLLDRMERRMEQMDSQHRKERP